MSFKRLVLISGLLLAVATGAAGETSSKVLRAYGPGGPHHVLEECAELFKARHGVEVDIIRVLPHELERRLPEDGDLYFGGAEYMLEEFDRRNPGIIDLGTVARLHPRRIGIIVRKGNPLDIQGLEDLQQEGVDLLDVKLENMRHFHLESDNGHGNIRRFEYTGQRGVAAWRSAPELDAWITYRSWHATLGDQADFIEIPGDEGLRYTPMALTHRTPHRAAAAAFISFLKSDEARRIFIEHGWD